jgi:hypothetical protein
MSESPTGNVADPTREVENLRIGNADLRKQIHELSRESDGGRVGRAWPSLDTSRVNRVAGAQNRDRYTEKENTYDR